MYKKIFSLLLFAYVGASFGMNDESAWLVASFDRKTVEEPLFTIFEEHDCNGEAVFEALASRKSQSRFSHIISLNNSDDNSHVSPRTLDNTIQLLADEKIGRSVWRLHKSQDQPHKNLDAYVDWLWSGHDIGMESLTPNNGRLDKELRMRIFKSPGTTLLKELSERALQDGRFTVVRVVAKRVNFSSLDFQRYRNNLKRAQFRLLAGRDDLAGIKRNFSKNV